MKTNLQRLVNWSVVLCTLLASSLAYSHEPSPDGNRGHLNRLLKNPLVEEHLDLSPDQAVVIRRISDEVLQDHREAFTQAMAAGTKAERVSLVAKVFLATNAQTFARMSEVLSEHQLHRLEQIEVQTMGVRAFQRPSVVESLSLSSTQLSELKALGDSNGAQLSALHRSPSETSSNAEKARELRKAALAEARKLLRAEQWVKWELLTGAYFAN